MISFVVFGFIFCMCEAVETDLELPSAKVQCEAGKALEHVRNIMDGHSVKLNKLETEMRIQRSQYLNCKEIMIT